MLNSCIIPAKLEEYRKALKERKLSIPELLKMTTQERTAVFKEFTGTDANAKTLNTLFEEKLVLKNKRQGIINFINKTAELKQYSPEGKAKLLAGREEDKAKQTKRILSPKGEETFLNDLADKILGTHISREVAGKAFALHQEAQALKDPDAPGGVKPGYFKAIKEFNAYVDSQKPYASEVGHVLNNVTTLMRNNMLGFSTALKSITNQVSNTLINAPARRIGLGVFKGANPELKAELAKISEKRVHEEQVNDVGMMNINDLHLLNKDETFETPEGKIDKKAKAMGEATKLSNKVVIEWGHQVAFTKAYQLNWFDHADLLSTKLARMEGLKTPEAIKTRAAEIFRDAYKIDQPKEKTVGKFVREESQLQAARATSTNDTETAKYSMGIKRLLNNVNVKGIKLETLTQSHSEEMGKKGNLGDIMIPMAHIPASAISNNVEDAGLGLLPGILDMYEGNKATKNATTDEGKRQGLAQYSNGYQRLAAAVGVMTLGHFIVAIMPKKDLKADPYGGHYIHTPLGWLSMEWFGPLGVSIGGEIDAKLDKRKGMLAWTEDEISGRLKQFVNFPGVGELRGLIEDISSNKVLENLPKNIEQQLSARVLPQPVRAAISDRPLNRLLFGAHGLETDRDVKEDANTTRKEKMFRRKGFTIRNVKNVEHNVSNEIGHMGKTLKHTWSEDLKGNLF